MAQQKLFRLMAIQAVLVLGVIILVYARPFLVPLTFAALFAMLLLPAAQWLERKGIGRGWATLLAVLGFVLVITGLVVLIGWQISGVAEDAGGIEEKLKQQFEQLRAQLTRRLGLTPQEQQQLVQTQKAETPGKLQGLITGLLGGLATFLTSTVLVFVYLYLMLYLRARLRRFLLRLIPNGAKRTAEEALQNIHGVARKYFGGMALMIACLWVMYSIGFSIAGVKNPIFFAILCGLLEIVPFVGNLTGTGLTVGMSLAQGADSSMVIGILSTYLLIQFLQTYILEPLVVGAGVSINPLFTIAGIVAGELIWGIPGMILAIPLLGMFKIVCDNIEPLEPYGYLVGQDKSEGSFQQKIKAWMQKR